MLMDQRVTWMKKRIDFVSPGNCGLVRLVFFSAAHPSGPEIHIATPLPPAAPISKKSHPAIALLLRLFPLPLLPQLLKNHNARNQRGIFAIFAIFTTSFLATWSMFLKIVFEKWWWWCCVKNDPTCRKADICFSCWEWRRARFFW